MLTEFLHRKWPSALAAAAIVVLVSRSSMADDTKKKPVPAAPKPAAAAAKPAAAPRPAAGGAPASTHTPAAPASTHTPGGTPATHTPGGAPAHTPSTGTTRTPGGPQSVGRQSSAPQRPSVQGRAQTSHLPPPAHGGQVRQVGSNQVVMRGSRPSEIHRGDMAMRRGPGGVRRATFERGGRVYSVNRAGYGHIRSGYSYRGHDYAVRRYYVGGAYYPRYYRPYAYRGVFIDAYVPGVYYSPYYYGWAYRPWAAPVVFSWGWGGAPWTGYYGGYFTPYPSYPSANLWLTDYMVSQTLEASYRERVESARAANIQYNDQPPQQVAALTPEIKQMIADEVNRQLAAEAEEAKRSAGPPPPPPPPGQPEAAPYTGVGIMLEDQQNTHVLLSSANIDVTTVEGLECSISQGDAIAIFPGGSAGAPDDETAKVRVLASAGGGCPANSVVSISIQDLQEMVNHVRATIDSGLAEMQKGKGIPKPPAAVPTAATSADFAGGAPAADPNEAAELQRLNQEANGTEREVVGATNASYQETGPPPQQQQQQSQPQTQGGDIQEGMSPAQVIQLWGAPTNTVKIGASKQVLIYKNKGVTLTFINGKLADIQ